MKRTFFLASILTGFVATSSLLATPYYGKVAGKVTDDSLGHPIMGAKIGVFFDPVAGEIATTYSDSGGNYGVHFPIDSYSVSVYVACCKPGYIGEWWDNKFLPQSADPVAVINGQITDGINFALGRPDTSTGICGRVTEEGSGAGKNDAKVSIYSYPDTSTVIADVFSNNSGLYFIPVSQGYYLLRADKPGYEGEWYNEGTSEKVAVSDGQITPNINFTLERLQQKGAISGFVASEDPIEPLYAHVKLFVDTDSAPINVQPTTPNGLYRFGELAPGTYYVWAKEPIEVFISEWWDNKTLPKDADPIVVTDYEVTGIDFYLARVESIDVGAVAGWVKDTITMNPIKGAQVQIIGSNALHSYTDCDGKYLIKKVPVGMYRAVANAAGYYPSFSDSFNVFAGDTTKDINFLLMPYDSSHTGYIYGTVGKEADGQPLPNACVRVLPCGSNQVVAHTKTSPNGAYMLSVPPDKYNVVADAYGFNEEWYLEKLLRYDADTVLVEKGDFVGDIDFTLSSLERGGISGMVTDTAGIGIPGALVRAQGINNWFEGEARTDSIGAYLIEKLIPGLYKVRAIAGGYKPGCYPQPVEVFPDSVTPGIDIVLEGLPSQTGIISGIVKDDSTSAPIPHALVIVLKKPLTGPPFFGYAITNQNGYYVVNNVPVIADSVFYVVALAWEYIPEFYDGVYFWQNATLVPAPSDNIDFELGRLPLGNKGICGRITTQGKAGVENATIYAIDDEEIIGAAESISDGSYLLSQLPAGTYNLRISKPGYDDVTYGPVSVVDDNVSGVDIEIQTTGVSENVSPEKQTLWLSVTPNIANHNVTLDYTIPQKTHTELSVYDISGRKIVTLIKGKRDAGTHRAILNTDGLTQGIYFVRLTGGKSEAVRKLIILQ